MSTCHNATIMVGLPYNELAKWLGEEEMTRILDEDELRVASYAYDSDREENIIGYDALQSSCYNEIGREVMLEILTFQEHFYTTYGIEGKVYLTMFVY